jgi:hypothetical protein
MLRACLLIMFMMAVVPASLADTAPNVIDMTTVLTSDEGQPIPDVADMAPDDPGCKKCRPLTLGLAAYHALQAVTATEQQNGKPTPEEKWQRGALAVQVKTDPRAALSVEEIALIKARIGIIYGSMVILKAYPLLDPAAVPPKIK